MVLKLFDMMESSALHSLQKKNHNIFQTICAYQLLVAGRYQKKKAANPKNSGSAKGFRAIDH